MVVRLVIQILSLNFEVILLTLLNVENIKNALLVSDISELLLISLIVSTDLVIFMIMNFNLRNVQN